MLLNSAYRSRGQGIRVHLPVDASKFGLRSFGRICGVDQVHRVITDDSVSPVVVNRLEELGIAVTVV